MRFLRVLSVLIFAVVLPELQISSALAGVEARALDAAQSAVGRYLGDYSFVDQDGRAFRLSEYAGKPVVISFVYTACGESCPALIVKLRDTLKEAGGLGTEYKALTIGFDPENDTPAKLKAYGGSFAGDFKNWRLATADKETLDKFTKDAGFYLKKTDQGFEHLNLVTIVDPGGRVFEQLYSYELRPEKILSIVRGPFTPPEKPYRKSIEKAGFIERLKLFCSSYDPKTGRYVIDYTQPIGFALAVIAQLALGFVLFYIFRTGNKKRNN